MPLSPLTALQHRFNDGAVPFRVTTRDGIGLVGTRVGKAEPALVFCHGFLGWHRKPRVARFLEALSRWFTVYAADLRGHGRSGGLCTFGDREYLDVEALVLAAREDGHRYVATVGASMGGIAVVRHGGILGGADMVVAVSVPARWEGHRSASIRRMQRLTTTPHGRRLCRLAGARISAEWGHPESPEEIVSKIAPTPVLIVHGRDDAYFDEEEAWRLYRKASQPKRLLLASRFGHAEDGFTPQFAERLGAVVYGQWGLPWPA